MIFHEKLEDYFYSILNFNWEVFNTLSTREQASDWESLLGRFDHMIREEHQLNGIDFAITTAMIRIYSKRFQELPIKSSLYTKINSEFIKTRLYDFILTLKFEELQKKSTSICDCELRHEYNKKPDSTYLKEQKILYDGYYNPTLLTCTHCKFQWISYTADDDTGSTIFEKYKP